MRSEDFHHGLLDSGDVPRPHPGPTSPATLLAVLLTAWPATASAEARAAEATAPPSAGETVVLRDPTTLRALPNPLAAEVARLPAGTGALVLERHGPWVRLRASDAIGWAPRTELRADPEAAGPDDEPPEAAAGPDRALLGDDPAIADALAAARAALGADGRGGRLGPFALLTDVADPELLEYLSRVADRVPSAFSRRYGLRVAAGPLDAGPADFRRAEERIAHPVLGHVVLFAHDGDYRHFSGVLAERAGQHAAAAELADFAGQSTAGVAGLSVQGSPPADVAHTLLHEAAHLLVGRTLGRGIPVWLDEGLAGDLELGRIDRRGRIVADRLRVRPAAPGVRSRLEGPLAALPGLLADARRGRLERLDHLLALERSGLYRSPRRRELYALTALWVRYLLDGEDGALAGSFRAWLAAAAADPTLLDGDSGGAASLTEHLGRTTAQLDLALRAWLHDLARRLRVG